MNGRVYRDQRGCRLYPGDKIRLGDRRGVVTFLGDDGTVGCVMTDYAGIVWLNPTDLVKMI